MPGCATFCRRNNRSLGTRPLAILFRPEERIQNRGANVVLAAVVRNLNSSYACKINPKLFRAGYGVNKSGYARIGSEKEPLIAVAEKQNYA
jgi:hypothetical protein